MGAGSFAKRHGRRRRFVAGALLQAWLLASCAELGAHLPLPSPGSGRITEEELRAQLVDFSGRFSAVVSATADEISEKTDRRAVRKRALLWKVRTIPLVQDAAFGPDVQEAYVSILTVTVMLRQYLTEGDGRTLLGELQPVAADAARRLEDDARALGTAFLTPQELARVGEQVDKLARERRIQGREFDVRSARLALADVHRSSTFAWVVNLPMTPFRALEGVSSGAAAVHEFNQTARQFSKIVEGLPEAVRWETELLLYGVEDRDTVVQGLAAFESLAESARRASEAVDQLPDDLRGALGDSQAALVDANQVIQSAQALLGPLSAGAEQVKLAGASWAELFRREGAAPSRPFDVGEWESAARQIGDSAQRLEALASELRRLVESQQLGSALGGVASTVARTEASAQSVVDAAAWRGFQLLVAFFALLGGYRLLAWRLGRRAP